jgi:predicted DCC family thiol-disulfide oxidoreductase YuxK
METPTELIVVFDTDCLMCSAWVRFILRHEKQPTTSFVSAWSKQGLALGAMHNLTPQDLDKTYLVVSEGRGFTKTDATVEVFKSLKGPWLFMSALQVFPRPLRDWFYDRMAKNRYRWFGHQDQCFLPPEGQSARFTPGPPRSSVLPDHR